MQTPNITVHKGRCSPTSCSGDSNATAKFMPTC